MLHNKKMIFVIATIVMLVMMPALVAEAKGKPKLTTKSKTMTVGTSSSITLKNAGKTKWKTSNKNVIAISKVKKNKVVIKAKKKGKATITATYKKKKYKITITVKSKNKPQIEDNPVLNATDVKLYYMSDTAKRFVKEDKSHLREFRFKVTGTDKEVKSWELVGENSDFFDITSGGLVTIFWGPDYDDWSQSATVKATLVDGRVLTAKVTVYSEMNFYINELFQKFVDSYITSDMNDLEKAEKAAWYIGAYTDYKYYSESWITLLVDGYGDCMASRFLHYEMCKYMGVKAFPCYNYDYHGKIIVKYNNEYYMFTTGFNEPKPRSYTMYKIEEQYLDKVFKDNNITEAIFE